MAVVWDWCDIAAGAADYYIQFGCPRGADVQYLWAYGTSGGSELDREMRLLSEAELIAELIELRLPQESPALSPQGLRAVSLETLLGFRLRKGLMVELYAPDLKWLSGIERSQTYHEISDISTLNKPTPILLFFKWSSELFNQVLVRTRSAPPSVKEFMTRALEISKDGRSFHHGGFVSDQGQVALVSTAVFHEGSVVGLLAVTESTTDWAQHRVYELEKLLQIFAMAIPTMFGLSIYFASTISTPISNLAAAMELGRDLDRGSRSDPRMRIPDLSDRPDKIGRLSNALRGMITALYDRIDANEWFASDVAHEIKNPWRL